MNKVTIIGAGNVGATIAYTMTYAGIASDILLIDVNHKKAEGEALEMAKVIREGELDEIHVSEVVVGDIVYLQTGNKLPADGEFVDGAVKIDQACLNGETEEADKFPNTKGEEYDIKDLLNTYYGYRGTVVTTGGC